jgi:Zn-dependent protease with chaperone function
LILVGVSVVASGVNQSRKLSRVRRRLSAMPQVSMPPKLTSAARVARRFGFRVRCLDVDLPAAFCAGTVRPAVYVTNGLVSRLAPEELDAVLLHEAEHARSREPLRRLAARALAEALFFIPILAEWASQRQAQAELRADRAAVSATSPSALAGAMVRLGSPPTLEETAFGGATEIRVAQLLGDAMPAPRTTLRGWILSLAGCGTFTVVGYCLVQDLHVAVSAWS